VERVFRIQGDIDRYERAHAALDREERDQGIVRSTPRGILSRSHVHMFILLSPY
jgi:hypothetical protein